MLPRTNRLAHRRDFGLVYSRGRRFQSPFVAIHALSRGRGEPRFGISVSKKVGGAVQRNLVKRRIREACRAALGSGVLPMDYVLVARQSVLEADFGILCETVEQLIRRVAREGGSWKSHRPTGRETRGGKRTMDQLRTPNH